MVTTKLISREGSKFNMFFFFLTQNFLEHSTGIKNVENPDSQN